MSSSEETAPGQLELVRAFVNTLDLDIGEETLSTPADLERWLGDRGLEVGRQLDEADLERTLEFREALRAMLLANNRQRLDASTVEALRAAAGQGLLRIDIDADGHAALAPAGGEVDDLVARLLAAVAEAQAEGSWERLKACPADDCRWAFYDQSRNRSRIWCSMNVCGNRAKTRSYRARKA